MESKEDKCLEQQLWQACAGSMVQIPSVNSSVFYFPQGHCEHASGFVDLRNFPRVPSSVPCRVSGVKFMADRETDEVFAKIMLVPINGSDLGFQENESAGRNAAENRDKPTSFAKTLTQSDANNGGGFSVPRYCAETIFPRLDYSADPPVQTIIAKDVHGETWKFRHIYRGTPRRHLLTTGWSTFVNHKGLVAGDSVVFMRGENGDLCVGIRRAKKGIGGGLETPTWWNSASGNVNTNGGLQSDESWINRVRVKSEDVVQAATLAAAGEPFQVVYYPRASTPEFCIKAAQVKAAMQIRWFPGMRFKMAFETEDSSRISWFMGTISSVNAADPLRWPDSPWRLLQVIWDEPDLLQNVKRVSPWLVELVSSNLHSSFAHQAKKMRLPHQEFPLGGHILLPSFSSHPVFRPNDNLLGCFPISSPPAGMQGARHAQYGFPTAYFHQSKRPSAICFQALNSVPLPSSQSSNPLLLRDENENVSCLLTIGNSGHESDTSKSGPRVSSPAAPFVLFGQPILTDKQIAQRSLNDDDAAISQSDRSGLAPATGDEELCQVFLESDEVGLGRTLDLSSVSCYDELRSKISDLFSISIDAAEISNLVVYLDASGAVRKLGDEPFRTFMRSARRLTVLAGSRNKNSSSDNARI